MIPRAQYSRSYCIDLGESRTISSPRKEEHDHNTWSTRVWFSFAVQQLAVAFHNAVAQEALDEVCTAAASAVPVSPTW